MNPELLVITSGLVSGLMGSAHCAAMCGGIATGFSGLSHKRGWLDALEPNVGRVLGYTLAGAIAGGIGHGIVSLARLPSLTLALRAAVGVVLIITALRLLDRSGRLAFLTVPGKLWHRLFGPLQKRLQPIDTTGKRVLAGVLWAFLPCGLSSTVLFAAWLQSDALRGATTMLAFGLGTLPVMLPLTWSGARLGQRLQQGALRNVAAGFVLLAGVTTLAAPLLMRIPALHGVLAALGCATVAPG